MNEQRFTVHINFVKHKRFIEKKRISGLYLDFYYIDDYDKLKHPEDRNTLVLATLYASNIYLMENFRSSRVISSTSIYNRGFNIVSDNLLINKGNYRLKYNDRINDDILSFFASHNLFM